MNSSAPNTHTETPPDLPDRFLAPEGWRWNSFSRKGANGDIRKIRFGSVFPQETTPKAVVVCLPGLSDFGEKYFELAHDIISRDMAFWVIDWVGQGKSTRYLENTHKRHSAGFQEDVNDLHQWITDYILPSAVHTDAGRLPLIMLGHSMGGHIGLHYLAQHPDTIMMAAFSAPMCGIKTVDALPKLISKPTVRALKTFAPTRYAPGHSDWNDFARKTLALNIFSSDQERAKIHDTWCYHDPLLQVGGVTNTWLFEAVKSCQRLQNPNYTKNIKTPTICVSAGKEMLTNNTKLKNITDLNPNISHAHIPESKHEILLETDEIRDTFFKYFDEHTQKFVLNNPDRLQPF